MAATDAGGARPAALGSAGAAIAPPATPLRSPRPARERLLPAALAALALVLALIQRPGLATSDTKIDLHVDPARFLGQVASAWSDTGDLGHVQGGQYGGYLFPMGPFFALGHALGLAPWLVHRLWLALILALSAWGAVKLMDELAGRRRGLAHAVAGFVFLLNPYVVVFTARTTVTLLGYAALPWLLVCVVRGLRAPRSLWWPAAFALIVTSSGGGVNAAVTAWVLAGPVLLALYERWTGAATTRALIAYGWRTVALTAVASAWWIVPLLVQSRYGVDFLRFTEQPGTIWSTTSLPESLRLMGYWISYLGVGYGGILRPYFADGGVLLFFAPVVICGLLVPALALAGFAWTRQARYAPFLLGLILFGLIVMTAGFPEGTPLRRAANFTYNHVAAIQFLRTTYKAGPLVALGIAGLAGLAAARHRAWLAVVPLALIACWPLTTGRALDRQIQWHRIPPAWRAAAAHVDREDRGARAVVLPGQLYAYYRWGGTIDPILPVLAKQPVALRGAVSYSDPHATDLLWTLDALVEQRRALPGELAPMLDLLGARTVLAGADDDRTRSGAATPSDAADVLDQLGPPTAHWGPVRPRERAAGTLGGPRRLPEVRAWDRPGAPGLVRLEPAEPDTVLDGSAEGLAALGRAGSVAYAADLAPAAIRGARNIVISDSNRRRVLVVSRMSQNAGPTLAADQQPSVDAAVLDPFPARGSAAQTVAVYSGGIRGVSAPSSPGYTQFPEQRPFAAIDGDTSTHWQADRALLPDRHVLSIAFDRARDVGHVDLMPYDEPHAAVTAVAVNGRRFAVHRGWNRLALGLHGVRALQVRLAHVTKPRAGKAAAGGIRELRIPGVHPREALRPPVIAERALRGADLSHTALTYLFQRTTGDDPFRRDPQTGPAGPGLVRNRGDGERGLSRVFSAPAAREWTADGWASAAPAASDEALDRLAGVRRGFASSGRFEGRAGWRASSAFDGTPRPWIGSWRGRAWIAWKGRRTVRAMRLAFLRGVRRPTVVRLHADGSVSPPLRVRADGTVRVPAMHGTRFRLDILRAAFPPGTPGFVKQRRAVGIAEITGDVPHVRMPRSGPLRGRCGDLVANVSGRRLALRVVGSIQDLDAGRPVRMRGCGGVALPAGPARLTMVPAALAPYLLRLRSGSPPPPARAPGRVIASDDEHARLSVGAPARLVLAEAYTSGRRASCDGRDLGAPQVGDGFATAWRVPAGCREVTFSFAPDRLVRAGYVVSGAAGLALLALLLVRRPPRREAERAGSGGDAHVVRLPAKRAALVALPVALGLGFVFAARGTPLFLLGVFLVLWRGIGARRLSLAAGALLVVVVPALTLLVHVQNRGGYNPEYAAKRILVHWAAVAGVTLLILALARTLSRARGRWGPAPAARPSRAARPARGP